MQRFQQIVMGVLGVLLLIVIVESVRPRPNPPKNDIPVVEVPCVGDPIKVDFAFNGGVNDPWSCQIQCSDKKPRYILYSNGKATQCETPPGCNDIGEDTGVTCSL